MSNYKRIFLSEALVSVFLLQSVFPIISCSHKNYTGPVNYHFKSDSQQTGLQ